MTDLTGYIQRRSGSLTPDEQADELRKYGVVCGGKPEHDPIYDELDDAIPSTEKAGHLVVWELAIIGLGNINRVFVELGKVGAEGIYDIKDKEFYPCHEEADKKHARARAVIVKANSKVRVENSEGKSGKPLSKAWANDDKIKRLASKGKHPADLANEYGVSKSTINRIINETEEEKANREKK